MDGKRHIEPKPSKDDSLDRFLVNHKGRAPDTTSYLKGECQKERKLFQELKKCPEVKAHLEDGDRYNSYLL